jgi:hypothetical protein
MKAREYPRSDPEFRIVAMKSPPARIFDTISHILLGGIVFWAPNIAVHWITGFRFSYSDAIGVTFLLPAATYLFFRMFWWPLRKQEDRLSAALFAVLGIWILGPSMLTFSASFCGGGLTQPDAWHFFVIGTPLFPLFTFVMSTYDGTLFALLLVTLLLPILANYRPKRNPAPAGSNSW